MTKIDKKSIVLLTLVFFLGAFAVAGQKKQTATNQNVWQEVKLDLWEVKFSIPKDLKAIPQTEDDKPDLSDENFDETRNFTRLRPTASRLKMSIFLRNLKGETVKTENKGKEYNLTPEDLLLLDFIGDSEGLKRKDSPVLEADYHEIDGVTGLLVVHNASMAAGKTIKPTNDIVVTWGTYRLFKGNVQRMMFSIEAKRTQLETMKKIINSLKFN